MKQIALILASAFVAAPAIAGPYVNVESNASYTGSDYTNATTDFHVGYEGEVPFIADIKNRESLQSIDGVIKKLQTKRILPVEHLIKVRGDVRAMPNGSKYAVFQASLGEMVALTESDNEALKDFVSYVENQNDYILNKWDETHVQKLDSESSKIVSNIVDLEDFE